MKGTKLALDSSYLPVRRLGRHKHKHKHELVRSRARVAAESSRRCAHAPDSRHARRVPVLRHWSAAMRWPPRSWWPADGAEAVVVVGAFGGALWQGWAR